MRRMQAKGFTLIELMVTIVIVAILAAIAFPSFQNTLRSTRVSGASNEFSAALALARTEAIRSTRSAGICGANAAGTACVDSTQWPDGMLIWLNADVAAPDYDAADTLVRFVQGKKGLALSVPVSSATGNAQFRLLFDSRGRLADQPAAGRIATLKSEQCPSGQTLARNFAINAAGQANMTRVNCS